MARIDYDHASNLHTSAAPAAIVKHILDQYRVSSVLDVGCGTGVWLQEFMRLNILDVYGVDGISTEGISYLARKGLFRCIDLREDWVLGKKFDLAICLEVAEHLPPESAHVIIRSLCAHSDLIIFSAACPHQGGQGHINCQWPTYWQAIFNDNKYTCIDSLRPRIWQEDFPEYWYKQNIFIAYRDPGNAGREDRLHSLVHPQLLKDWIYEYEIQQALANGRLGLWTSIRQSLKTISNTASSAIQRKFFH